MLKNNNHNDQTEKTQKNIIQRQKTSNQCSLKAKTKKAHRENPKKNDQTTIKRFNLSSTSSIILNQHIQYAFKFKNIQYVPQYVQDIIGHLLDLENKRQQIMEKSTTNNKLYSADFATHICCIIDMCDTFQTKQSIYATCHFFHTLYKIQNWSQKDLQYLIITSIFTASKYHQIYPPFLDEFIQIFNPTMTVNKVVQLQGKLLAILNFQCFFVDHEQMWLDLLGIILQLEKVQQTRCKFILQSGLTNINLYSKKSSLKCIAVISLYNRMFCPEKRYGQMCLELFKIDCNELLKCQDQYKIALKFNKTNELTIISSKFFIQNPEQYCNQVQE